MQTGFLSRLRTSLCSYQGAVLHVAIWPLAGGRQRGDAGHALSLHYVLAFALQLSKSQETTVQATEQCGSQFLV